mgnify:CR=1 FL=1
MVVADSSGLIPLAWVGRLDLVSETFDELRTTEEVRAEVLVDGMRGTAALKEFLTDVIVHDTPARAGAVASMEGLAVADASVILLAEAEDALILANDKGLIEAARSHDVECWWVTTLLLDAAAEGDLSADEAADVLYELVNAGMNLHLTVYSQVQRKLRELGD